MRELTTEERQAADAAIATIREGLAAWLAAVADEGEPEVAINALLLFEAQGMAAAGIFHRLQYLTIEQTGSRTSMLGMLELVTEKVQHDLRCSGHDSE